MTSVAIAEAVHPDLDVGSYTVLVTLSDLSASMPGGSAPPTSAEALRLHKSTLSPAPSTVLERLGLVERETSEQDARALNLSLTPSGRTSPRRGHQRPAAAGVRGPDSLAEPRTSTTWPGRWPTSTTTWPDPPCPSA